MLARIMCVALCVVAACFACATATVVNDRAERRDIGSSIDSITSVIGSGYNNATSQVGSFVCAVTEVDRGVGTVLTLVGSQVATVLTSNCASITLAPTGFGVTTSFAGSTYTEATGNVTSVFAAAASSHNAALRLQLVSTSSPLLGGLAMILVGVVIGVLLVL